MRFISYKENDQRGLAIRKSDGQFRGLVETDPAFPKTEQLLTGSQDELSAVAKLLLSGRSIDPTEIEFLPPITSSQKIICVGLNYLDHTTESGAQALDYPSIFGRFASSLIGHEMPIIRPTASKELDFEGELVAIIGKGGQGIPRETALDHVAGYSIFNDVSVRDFQMRTSQWTMGKNFDGTGAFGPEFITADELPPGCKGLTLTTRLNGEVVQQASTDEMIFDIASLVVLMSEVMTLVPGDVIVSGTPAGVGMARKPPLWMKPGDVVEVEIEQLGILRNTIRDQEENPTHNHGV